MAGTAAHIDFVLSARSKRVYVVAECKRADPARSEWCFVPAPFTWRNEAKGEVVFDEVQYSKSGDFRAYCCSRISDRDSCHLGFELKSGQKGDGIGGRSPISKATTQVLRGVNGLVNHLFARRDQDPKGDNLVRFLPVVFTTAELYVADGDIGEADIQSGMLPADWGKVRKVDWLWFTHNQSPSLQHKWHLNQGDLNLTRAVRTLFARTVAVVGRNGVDQFLSANLEEFLEE